MALKDIGDVSDVAVVYDSICYSLLRPNQDVKVLNAAARKIEAETQELRHHTDAQVRQAAEYVQMMSEEILEQKQRLLGNKESVKDTCREVKIFLEEITDLAEDKWRSLSEDAKLNLDSVIRMLRQMTVSVWKLIFCVLLLHELRDIFDSLKSESINISLNRGRLKYAFKMASMLILWLSHDVETNPGPQFNERKCVETYVRLLSQALRDDLDTDGSIWSKKIANAAYNAGYSRTLRWNNPSSGKNKDSLPKLKERAEELIRLLSDKNCLPSDLAVFTDLDQQETLNELRKYLEFMHFKKAANVLLDEPSCTPSLKEHIRHLIQLAQAEISNSNKRTIPNSTLRPLSISNVNEFQQLADSQCLNDSVGDGTGLPGNEARTDCPGSPSPLTTNMDKQRHEGENQGLTCRVYTQSVIAGTRQNESSTEAGTKGSTFDDNQENIMTATPGTDVSLNHEEQRNVNMVSSSDSYPFDKVDCVETPHDILGHINPNTDAPVDIFMAQLESDLSKFMQGGVESILPDTYDMTSDVPLPTDTSDEALMAVIESGPSRVFNVDDVNTSLIGTNDTTNDVSHPTNTSDEDVLPDLQSGPSHVLNSNDVNTSRRYIPNADYAPNDQTQNDIPAVDDGGCADHSPKASEPLQKASTDNNRVATVGEGVYAIPEEACNTHDCQETFGPEACEATVETDTQTCETETDTQTCVTTAEPDTQASGETTEADTQTSEITRETDTQACVTTREIDMQACVTTRETDIQACVTTTETDTQACVTTAETNTQTCVTTRENNAQACVTTREIDTQAGLTTSETDTQTCVTTTDAETQTYVTTAGIGTQTYLETAETNTQTHVTTAEVDTQAHVMTVEVDTQTHIRTAEGDTHTYISTTDTDPQPPGTTAESGQTPRSLGTCSLSQVGSDESETPSGRRSDINKKRKQQAQHSPSKKRRI